MNIKQNYCFHHKNTLIYEEFLACKNVLKLTCSNAGIQKYLGGETPGTLS